MSTLRNPGDFTEFSVRDCKRKDPSKPYRVRWTYMDRARTSPPPRDEARSWVSPQDCYEKAMRKVEDMQAKEAGKLADGEMLLSTLLEAFKDDKKNIRATTKVSYEQAIKRITLRLGNTDCMIGRLDPIEISRAFNVGSRADEAAAQYLRNALEWARDYGYMTGPNPAKRLRVPEFEKEVRRPMTPAHLATLLQTDWNAEERAFFTLAIYTAMRLGELMALRWDDIKTWGDILNPKTRQPFYEGSIVPVLHLQRKHSALGAVGGHALKAKREGKGGRPVTLGSYILHVLKLHKDAQRAGGYTGELMFPSPEGVMYRPDHFRNTWYGQRMLSLGWAKRNYETAKGWIDCEYVPHELRHTGISLREGLRLNTYMQLEVGHAIPGVHADYVMLDPDVRMAEAEKVSSFLQRLALGGKIKGKVDQKTA